jgi:hypothetical protein
MANFTNETFSNYDDYMTPKNTWENIKHLIPPNKIIWEAFYGSGESGKYLTELGFNVIHENIDFFKNDKGEIIVSNPPFTKIKQVLKRLKELGKPFILIMPSSKINTQYVRELFMKDNDKLQIIIPRKRIQFIKYKDGKPVEDFEKKCNFDCFYYCWKINLNRDITWLE